MVQPTVWLHYRPVRIGWVVMNGHLADFQAAIRLSTCLWGGRYNPIVPTDDLDLARNLVEAFGIDLLIPVRDTPEAERVIEAFPHLVAGMGERAVFTGADRRLCLFADVSHPVRRLHQEGSKLRVVQPAWSPDDPLAPLLTALFGEYPEPSKTGLDYNQMLKTWLNAEEFKIQSDASMDPHLTKVAKPLGLTALYLHHAQPYRWQIPGVVIGRHSSYDDLLLLWNLRAAGESVQLYDPSEPPRLRPWLDSFLTMLRERDGIRERDGESAKYLNLWSREQESGHDLDLSGFNVVHRATHDANRRHGFSMKRSKVSFTHFHIDVISSLSQAPEGKSVRFSLPQKPLVALHKPQAG